MNQQTQPTSTNPPSNSIGFALKEKVAELEKMLTDKHPRMEGLLREIWVALKKQPENVTLMTEEEVHTVFNGLEHQMNTFMAEKAMASKKSATKSKVTAASLDL